MIEVIANGPVRVINGRNRFDEHDGSDRIVGNVKTVEQTEVEVRLELEQGHVNLEGFAPSRTDWGVRESFGRFVRDGVESRAHSLEFVDDEWDVKIRGESFHWIQQAHRYLTERPENTMVEILEQFAQWDETNTDSIDEAILQVHENTTLGNTELKEMSNDEWNQLRDELNELWNVKIPESYTNREKQEVTA